MDFTVQFTEGPATRDELHAGTAASTGLRDTGNPSALKRDGHTTHRQKVVSSQGRATTCPGAQGQNAAENSDTSAI